MAFEPLDFREDKKKNKALGKKPKKFKEGTRGGKKQRRRGDRVKYLFAGFPSLRVRKSAVVRRRRCPRITLLVRVPRDAATRVSIDLFFTEPARQPMSFGVRVRY